MKKTQTYSWLTKILLTLNGIFILCLIFSFLASHIAPETIWHFAFFGITYPIWLSINILFIIYWLFRGRWFFIFSLITIILGWNHVSRNFQLRFEKKDHTFDSTYLSLLCYNVKNFDLYNYNRNWEINHTNRKHILTFIQKLKPDIMCLQEFVNIEGDIFPTFDSIKTFYNKKVYHHIHFTGHNKNNHFGIATFSIYPIIDKGVISFNNPKGNNTCIYTDIVIKTDTVRVYNFHLQSIHLGKEEYRFAQEVKESLFENNNDTLETSLIQGIKPIARLLKRAFIKRSEQVKMIKEHMANCPYPILVCGDMNDTPSSYAYYYLSHDLTDAFKLSGTGVGETYSGIFPLLRIDYIFHSKDIHSTGFTKHPNNYSDHHPIHCHFKFAKE